MDQEIVHLSGFGVHQHRPAASAAIVGRVSACDEDRRRAYGVLTRMKRHKS
jgi:hypothetical protein